MKKLMLLTCFVLAFFASYGQDDFDKVIFKEVEKLPVFPGGVDGWRAFLTENLNRTVTHRDSAEAGRYRVRIAFVVERDGSLSDFNLIEQPKECPSCAVEALRVMKKSPTWTPGAQNGRTVRVSYVIPIVFVVNE